VRCSFCQQPIEYGERVYHEVIGWEEERRQGGTNALRLRSRTGAQAHWVCVDKAVGGHAGQLDLTLSDHSAIVGSPDRMKGAR